MQKDMPSARATSTPGGLIPIRSGIIHRRTLQALFSLISAALLFRIGGMVNQVIISARFGAGGAMDAYFVAGAFPLLFVQLVSSAIEASVIPVYSRWRLETQRDRLSRLLSTLINSLVVGAGLCTLIFIVLRRSLIFLLAPGLDTVRLQQAVFLAPLLYLAIPFCLVINLLECVLNVEGQFGWPAYAGLLVPLATALFTVLGGQVWGVMALCTGTFCGTLLQLIVVGIRARRARLRYYLTFDLRNPELHVILRAACPVLVGALITQGGPLVDQVFASALPAGNIAALNYALKLVSAFIGVIFVSLGRVALPCLARQAALEDPGRQAFKETVHIYLWSVGLCMSIFSVLLFLLAHPLIELLFYHGAFSATDVQNTCLVFLGFVPGLLPMAWSFLLSRAFNALGATRVPMYMALVSVGANAFFDALFVHFWGALGLALATSVVSFIVCLLLLTLLRRHTGLFAVWPVPFELYALAGRFCYLRPDRDAGSRGRHRWRKRQHGPASQRTWLYVCITGGVLVAGIIISVRDALLALRLSIGSLLLLSFLRYPFVLLLAWASLTVGIGSSLSIFNGNNLDMVLILPLCCLLLFLPWKRVLSRMPGLLWWALYLVWVLLGIGLSPLAPRAFLTLWLTMLASIGAGVLALALISTRVRLLRLLDGLLLTALLAALYGCYGFVTRQHGEVDPVTSLFRITSLFTQATTLAFYLSLVLPLAFYRCLYARGISLWISISITCCLLVALALTFTRSAYIGVGGEIIIMVWCVPGYRVRLLVICGLLLLCGGGFYLFWSIHLDLLARFFTADVATFNGRLYLWQALWDNFQVTHWLGNGLMASDQLLAYLRVGTSGQGVIGTAPHSLFLGTLYDHGVIGLLLLCTAFLSLSYGLLRGLRRSRGERRMLYGVALACVFSVLLQSLGSRDLWIQAAGAPFWIIVALPFACYWTGKGKRIRAFQGGDTCNVSMSSPVPDFLPLCQIEEYVEGEV